MAIGVEVDDRGFFVGVETFGVEEDVARAEEREEGISTTGTERRVLGAGTGGDVEVDVDEGPA